MGEDLAEQAGAAADFAESYDDTFEKAAAMFCTDADCADDISMVLPGLLPEVDLETNDIDTSLLEDPNVQDFAATAVSDFGDSIGADTSVAAYLLTHPDEVTEVAQDLIEDSFGQGWFSDFFGSFVEGTVNSGMERRGEREHEDKDHEDQGNWGWSEDDEKHGDAMHWDDKQDWDQKP